MKDGRKRIKFYNDNFLHNISTLYLLLIQLIFNEQTKEIMGVYGWQDWTEKYGTYINAFALHINLIFISYFLLLVFF